MSAKAVKYIPIRSLRAMRDRWKRDLARIEEVYPVEDWTNDDPHHEVIRNLSTAIAQIDGVITGLAITRL